MRPNLGMGSVHSVVERAYDAGADAVLPPLVGLLDVASVAPPVKLVLEATYFDTAGLVLGAAGITLRRRTGGEDDGWLLRLPAVGDASAELRMPLGRAVRTVPGPLREAARAYVQEHRMSAVLTLAAERTAHRLLDDGGRVLATVLDDRVIASLAGRRGEQHEWREWRVALGDGSPSLLEDADALLLACGAAALPVASASARVLGHAHDAFDVVRQHGHPAAAVLHARLAEQVADLKRRDIEVRWDAPDGVHGMRVALRRLRSALATFRPLLDRATTDPLRAEMKWVADLLGEARDAEVTRERLAAIIATQPADLLLGPVARRVDEELVGARSGAWTRAVEAMGSGRYFTLLERLDSMVADPPWAPAAQEQTQGLMIARVRRDWRRLRRAVADASAGANPGATPGEGDVLLHEARKAAKRLRYAAETVAPAIGRDAERLVTSTKRVQSALGDHHDTVVTRTVLRSLGIRAHLEGDNAFTYGLLHAVEQAHADEAEVRFAEAWKHSSRKKATRWLTDAVVPLRPNG